MLLISQPKINNPTPTVDALREVDLFALILRLVVGLLVPPQRPLLVVQKPHLVLQPEALREELLLHEKVDELRVLRAVVGPHRNQLLVPAGLNYLRLLLQILVENVFLDQEIRLVKLLAAGHVLHLGLINLDLPGRRRP